MYKVTLSKGYTDFTFVFVSIEAAGRFIEKALDASLDDISFTVKLNREESNEESEEESDDTNREAVNYPE